MVDSGSEVSILPPSSSAFLTEHTGAPRLRAANGRPIKVFSVGHKMTLDLGLGRTYQFNFLIADVPIPILGADFLREHGLVPDMRNSRLHDCSTHLSVSCCHASPLSSAPPVTIATVNSTEKHPAPPCELFASLRSSQKFKLLCSPSNANVDKPTSVTEHMIITNGRPVFARARRLPPDKLRASKEEVNDLLSRGILVSSSSEWASPIHLVKKGDSTSFRTVGCYERLNAITVKDRYPVPDVQLFADQLSGSAVFSKLDLKRAFAQIPVHPAHRHKTAIITPFGLYEYTRMPFGLCNAAQTFQRFIDGVLRGLPRVFVYIDDILVYSPDAETHIKDLTAVLDRLLLHGLVISPEKCVLGASSIEFLGYKVSSKGLAPMHDRVDALKLVKPPQDVTSCRRFIGMMNYYHRFIPRLAEILSPLHELANRKKSEFSWEPAHQNAFDKSKSMLSSAVTLAFPRQDIPIQVVADASSTAIGAVLQQEFDNKVVPLAFHSKMLSIAQKKWSAGDRELFALVSAVRRFRHLLEGRADVQLVTDHKPLTYAFTSKTERSARVTRQLAFLSEYSTDIRHVSGAANAVSDCLSRPHDADEPPVSTCLNIAQQEINATDLAKRQSEDPEVAALCTNPSLTIRKLQVAGTEHPLIVDVSTGSHRPLLPPSLRRPTFDRLHGIHHPGIRATRRLITERFVWKGMSADINQWTRTCLHCQSSKVGRHQSTPLQRPSTPSGRFEALHVDIVGPLDPANGHRFLFTIIDRFTRYPEAVPMTDSTAESCARALLGWISRFGMCLIITSDRGRQFVGELWNELWLLLGVQCATTLAYQPQQNGLVERLHRTLKASLMASLQNHHNWLDILPLVMLGLRSALKPDIGCSPAQLVFGEPIRLPHQFFSPTNALPNRDFVRNISTAIARLRPVPTSWHQAQEPPPTFVSPHLSQASHVFVRVDAHRGSLDRPYKGPYPVVHRGQKSFLLDLGHRTDNVAIDRLKPAFLATQDYRPDNSTPASRPLSQVAARESGHETACPPPPEPSTVITRSGREKRRPLRFADYI